MYLYVYRSLVKINVDDAAVIANLDDLFTMQILVNSN